MRPFTSLIVRPSPLHSRSLVLRRLAHSTVTRNHQTSVPPRQSFVQVRRQRITKYGIFTWTLGVVSLGFVLRYLVGKVLEGVDVEELEEVEHAEGDEHEDEHEDDIPSVIKIEDCEPGSFIPLQIPRELPKEFYKQSDPDWQEFRNLSRDHKRSEAARRELADKIATSVAAMPSLQRHLGRNIYCSRFWLDFIYPDAPPPEYIRKVILFREDDVILTNQIIPSSHYQRLRHLLWPRALFRSTKVSINYFYRLQAIKVKRYLDITLSRADQAVQSQFNYIQRLDMDEAIARTKQDESQKERRHDGSKKLGSGTAPEANSLVSRSSSVKPTADQKNDDSNPEAEIPPIVRYHGRDPADPSSKRRLELNMRVYQPPIPYDLKAAGQIFLGSFVENWKASQANIKAKGCCVVSGNVEVCGSRMKCKLDVKALYDPKSGKYHYVSAHPRQFWELKQAPKGGP